MKRLIIIIALLLFAAPSMATVYYGGAGSKNINADDLWCTAVTGSCTCDGSPTAWATVNQAGNVLVANGCTIAIPNNVSLTVSVDKLSNKETDAPDADCVDGGQFTYTTAEDYALTVNSDLEAGGTTGTLLVISGSASGTKVTIGGGKNITGGSATGISGIQLNHTVGTVVIGASGNPVAATGGGSSTSRGIYVSGTGPATLYVTAVGSSTASGPGVNVFGASTVTMIGTCTGGTFSTVAAYGCDISGTGAATLNLTGDCVGADTGYGTGCGCSGTSGSTSSLNVTGNLIDGARGSARLGAVNWTPGASNYAKIRSGSGTYQYFGKPPAASNVLAADSIQSLTTASRTTGTASISGGGAWGF